MLRAARQGCKRNQGNNIRAISRFFMLILQAYRGESPSNVIPASEEDRHAQRTLKVVGSLLFAKKIDVEKVIAKIDVHCNRIVSTGNDIPRQS